MILTGFVFTVTVLAVTIFAISVLAVTVLPISVFARFFFAPLFLPLTVLLAPQTIFGKVSPWIGLVSGAWLLAFAALPFFGKERLRAGDIVAGTLVVRLPRELLLPDLAGREAYSALFLPADGE